MGDMGDIFKAMKQERSELRERLGVDCSGCKVKEPKRTPTILLPGQRCKVCGYRDPRGGILPPAPAVPTYVDCQCIACGWKDGFKPEALTRGLVGGRCEPCDRETVFRVVRPKGAESL